MAGPQSLSTVFMPFVTACRSPSRPSCRKMRLHGRSWEKRGSASASRPPAAELRDDQQRPGGRAQAP
eukprot:3305245-Lingulodinium_polyedra.AAC.1